MKKSIHTLFLEVVEEQKPNFNQPTKDEMVKVYNTILDRIDFTNYTQKQIERKQIVVKKFISLQFTEKNRRSVSLKKIIK